MGHAALREPSNQYTAFTHLPRTCMRGNHARRRRQAIPNRRRPDLGVCVQSLNCVPRFLAARPKGVAADRKVRGSRKRGYRKPVKVSCTPFCPSPREGRVPGCRPAASLPTPGLGSTSPAASKAAGTAEPFTLSPGGKKARARRGHNLRLLRLRRRNGGRFRAFPRRENYPAPPEGNRGRFFAIYVV